MSLQRCVPNLSAAMLLHMVTRSSASGRLRSGKRRGLGNLGFAGCRKLPQLANAQGAAQPQCKTAHTHHSAQTRAQTPLLRASATTPPTPASAIRHVSRCGRCGLRANPTNSSAKSMPASNECTQPGVICAAGNARCRPLLHLSRHSGTLETRTISSRGACLPTTLRAEGGRHRLLAVDSARRGTHHRFPSAMRRWPDAQGLASPNAFIW